MRKNRHGVVDQRRMRVWRWMALPERELTLVEDDVPRREHAPCGEVEASIAAVIGRVADEDAGS